MPGRTRLDLPARERQQIITEGNVHGAPDLVVEITSPHTKGRDKSLKAQIYARYGVNFYWVLDPATHTMEEYALEAGGLGLVGRHHGPVVVRPEIFPGWELDLGEVWE